MPTGDKPVNLETLLLMCYSHNVPMEDFGLGIEMDNLFHKIHQEKTEYASICKINKFDRDKNHISNFNLSNIWLRVSLANVIVIIVRCVLFRLWYNVKRRKWDYILQPFSWFLKTYVCEAHVSCEFQLIPTKITHLHYHMMPTIHKWCPANQYFIIYYNMTAWIFGAKL